MVFGWERLFGRHPVDQTNKKKRTEQSISLPQYDVIAQANESHRRVFEMLDQFKQLLSGLGTEMLDSDSVEIKSTKNIDATWQQKDIRPVVIMRWSSIQGLPAIRYIISVGVSLNDFSVKVAAGMNSSGSPFTTTKISERNEKKLLKRVEAAIRLHIQNKERDCMNYTPKNRY